MKDRKSIKDRLDAIEGLLRNRGVVDVKFAFGATDGGLHSVGNDVAELLEAVLARRTKRFNGLGDGR